MAGCFGNHWVDRHIEAELMRHLNREESVYCDNCDSSYSVDKCEWNDIKEVYLCPTCGKEIP